jgi:4-hydroxymandelate oxidase
MARAPRKRSTPKKARKLQRRDLAGAIAAWPVNLDDFEAAARPRLTPSAYAYIAGAAGDELTAARNRQAFATIRLKPRVLVDASRLNTRVELLGCKLEFPILLAPVAYHKLAHPDGELATVRGAGMAGAGLVVSTYATVSLEKIARAANTPLWMQLYVHPDRTFTRELVRRAEAAGYCALCLTVDSPVFGARNREQRAGLRLPRGARAENLGTLGTAAQATLHAATDGVYSPIVDPSLQWKDVDWLCSFAKLPVVLKGILAPEDAQLAVEHGAAAVIVSNHGGRNLDTVPATIEALPGIVEAVQGRIPVLLDGGIRRGTDVLKSLALGAKAVLIGRPYAWGLAVGGAAGVAEVVRILRDEFRAAMALCGTCSLERITRQALWPDWRPRAPEKQNPGSGTEPGALGG